MAGCCFLVVVLFAAFASASKFEGHLVSDFAGGRCLVNTLQTKDCWQANIEADGESLWRWTNTGTLQTFSGYCVLANIDSPSVSLVPCSNNDTDTKFIFESQRLKLQNNPSFCLDIRDPLGVGHVANWAWRDQDGLKLAVYECQSNRWSQAWTMRHANTGEIHVRVVSGLPSADTIVLTSAGFSHTKTLDNLASSHRFQLENTGANWVLHSTATNATQVLDLWGGVVYTVLVLPTQITLSQDYISRHVVADSKAYVRVIRVEGSTNVAWRSDDCYDCAWSVLDQGGIGVGYYVELNSDYPLHFEFSSNTISTTKTHMLGGSGYYTIILTSTDSQLVEDVAPSKLWAPIVVAVAVLVLIWSCTHIYLECKERFKRHKKTTNAMPLRQPLIEPTSDSTAQATTSRASPTQAGKTRLASLDTFRGISLVVMMFVNFGGGNYYYFNHSHWNGLTFADLVFPWFMFMMGASMALALRAVEKKKNTFADIALRTLQRTIVLFSFGAFFVGEIDWKTVRIFGVLQYFAFSYLFVTLIAVFVPKWNSERQALYFPLKTAGGFVSLNHPFVDVAAFPHPTTRNFSIRSCLQQVRHEMVRRWPEWLCALVFPLIHICVQFGLSVPGCPRGYLGPGGRLGSHGAHPYCTGGAHRFVDFALFGRQHSYPGGTATDMYATDGYYDPEGFLGALTATFLTFLGLQTGRVVVTFTGHQERITHLAIWGTVLCTLSGILCGFSRDHGPIPVDKNLWSLSFVLVMGGSANFMLAGCYYLVDVKAWWGGFPFKAVGMNSIFIYMMHEHFEDIPVPFGANVNTHAAALAKHLWMVAFWCAVAVYLYRKKVFFVV